MNIDFLSPDNDMAAGGVPDYLKGAGNFQIVSSDNVFGPEALTASKELGVSLPTAKNDFGIAANPFDFAPSRNMDMSMQVR